MRETILKVITGRSCITGTDLVLATMGAIGPGKFDKYEFAREVLYLTSIGSLIELRYIDPNMITKTFSLFFKKGTKILERNEHPNKTNLA